MQLIASCFRFVSAVAGARTENIRYWMLLCITVARPHRTAVSAVASNDIEISTCRGLMFRRVLLSCIAAMSTSCLSMNWSMSPTLPLHFNCIRLCAVGWWLLLLTNVIRVYISIGVCGLEVDFGLSRLVYRQWTLIRCQDWQSSLYIFKVPQSVKWHDIVQA